MPAAGAAGSRCPVTAALSTTNLNPVSGDFIYHLPPATAKTLHSHHDSHLISPSYNIRTALKLPDR